MPNLKYYNTTTSQWETLIVGAKGETGATGATYLGVTSTTSTTIGIGSTTFSVVSTGAYAVGTRVRVASTASPANFEEGVITALVANTSITVNVDFFGGSGTFADWTFSVAGSNGPAGEALPAGSIVQWGSNAIPANWLLCDGTAVLRTTWPSLFAAIGTTYGAGNGTTTFNLPDLRGRVAVGRDSSQTEFDALAETGGAKTHTLTEAQIPSHTHTGTTNTENTNHTHNIPLTNRFVPGNAGLGTALQYTPAGGDGSQNIAVNSVNHTHTFTTAATGGGGAHNNLQPYQVFNYIIKGSAGTTAADSELATRLGAVESGKANLAGGNSFSGAQNFSGLITGSGRIRAQGTASDAAGVLELRSNDGVNSFIYKENGGGIGVQNSTGGVLMTISQAGRVNMPFQPVAAGRLGRTGGATGIANLYNFHRQVGVTLVSSTRLTVANAGLYILSLTTICNISSARQDTNILVNGVEVSAGLSENSTTGFHHRSQSVVRFLNANDYVEYQNSDWYDAANVTSDNWKTFYLAMIG